MLPRRPRPASRQGISMRTLTFQVVEGVDKGRIFRDLPIPVTIGREEGNLLRLNDERVSRFHAKVQQEDGDVILTDLESTNGTRVNGSPIQIRRLRPGDQMNVGRSMLLVRHDGRDRGTRRPLNGPRPERQGCRKTAPIPGTVPGDDLAFDLHTLGATSADDRTAYDLARTESDMPPLPQKLTAAQSARLAEIFDYLHRGLADGRREHPGQRRRLGGSPGLCRMADDPGDADVSRPLYARVADPNHRRGLVNCRFADRRLPIVD